MPANNLSLVFVKVGRPSQPHISPARNSGRELINALTATGPRIIELLNRRVERIHIGVSNNPWPNPLGANHREEQFRPTLLAITSVRSPSRTLFCE